MIIKKKLSSAFIPKFQSGGLVYRNNIYSNPINTNALNQILSQPRSQGYQEGVQNLQSNMQLRQINTRENQVLGQLQQNNINNLVKAEQQKLAKEQFEEQKKQYKLQNTFKILDYRKGQNDKLTGLKIDPVYRETFEKLKKEYFKEDYTNDVQGIMDREKDFNKFFADNRVSNIIEKTTLMTEANKEVASAFDTLNKIKLDDVSAYDTEAFEKKITNISEQLANNVSDVNGDGLIDNNDIIKLSSMVKELQTTRLELTDEYKNISKKASDLKIQKQELANKKSELAINFENKKLDILNKPIGNNYTIEQQAQELAALEGKYKPLLGSGIDPKDQAEINKINAQTDKARAETAKILNESGSNDQAKIAQIAKMRMDSGIDAVRAFAEATEIVKTPSKFLDRENKNRTNTNNSTVNSLIRNDTGAIDRNKSNILLTDGSDSNNNKLVVSLKDSELKKHAKKMGVVPDLTGIFGSSEYAGEDTIIEIATTADGNEYLVTNNPILYTQATGQTLDQFKDSNIDFNDLIDQNNVAMSNGKPGIAIPLSEFTNNSANNFISANQAVYNIQGNNKVVDVTKPTIYNNKSIFNNVINDVIQNKDQFDFKDETNIEGVFNKTKTIEKHDAKYKQEGWGDLKKGWYGTPELEIDDPNYTPELAPKLKSLAVAWSKQFPNIEFTSYSRSSAETSYLRDKAAQAYAEENPNATRLEISNYIDRQVPESSGHKRGAGMDITDYNNELWDNIQKVGQQGSNPNTYLIYDPSTSMIAYSITRHKVAGDAVHLDVKLFGA